MHCSAPQCDTGNRGGPKVNVLQSAEPVGFGWHATLMSLRLSPRARRVKGRRKVGRLADANAK